jgi:hypothetical protein
VTEMRRVECPAKNADAHGLGTNLAGALDQILEGAQLA